jgi:plasmid stability protein
MSVLIQIRNVDETVRDALKARAAQQGISLNLLLRRLLEEEAARPDRAEVLARVAARSERAGMSSTELIRTLRDADSPRGA